MGGDRVIAGFVERVRADPLLAESLRVAPVQTIRALRDLDGDARCVLLSLARSGAFDGPQQILEHGLTNRVRVYVTTYSVTQGATLRWHAKLDGIVGPSSVYWRIVRVSAIEGPTGGTEPLAFPRTFTVVTQSAGAWPIAQETHAAYDREEVGYGWPYYQSTTSDWTDDTPGLYAMWLDESGGFDSTDDSKRSVAYFVVRPATPNAKILVCWPFMTLAAYAGDADDYSSTYNWSGGKRQRRLSLDRPWDRWPTGDKLRWSVRFPLLMWEYITSVLGHAADPCTSFDLHYDASLLGGYQLFVSAGHDEYWTKEMRDQVEAFVLAGGNAAFFSGNVCWGEVRLEDGGRTLVCYKNVVEDPLRGDDARLTGIWSSLPANRPENQLTGVSTRRGGLLGVGWNAKFEVVASGDPLLGDIGFGATIPLIDRGQQTAGENWMLDSENDGADFAPRQMPVQADAAKVTGLDGTPTNFKILAIADLRAAVQPGWATIGYFEHNGTVFAGSSIHWAAYLFDTNVAKVTKAVVDRLVNKVTPSLGQWGVLAPESPPAWKLAEVDGGLGLSVAPPGGEYPWGKLAANLPYVAIAAGIQGGLFAMRPDGTIDKRDVEHPSYGPWEATGMKVTAPGFAPALACGAHGAHLYCNASYGTEVSTFIIPLEYADTVEPIPSGRCVGLGATDDAPFFAVDDGTERWLWYGHRQIFGPGNTRRMGRWLHTVLTGGGFDGRLYAATASGDLVSREGNLVTQTLDAVVDLVWQKIGRVPDRAVAMAACAGRLFALVQPTFNSPTELHWRVARSDGPWRDPAVLLLRRGAQNSFGLFGELRGNGDFRRLGEIHDLPPFDIAARANDTDVLFYTKATGAAAIVRFAQNGTGTFLGSYTGFSSGWEIITHIGGEHVLFYRTVGNAGVVAVGRFPVDPLVQRGIKPLVKPDFHQQLTPTSVGSSGWTHIAASHDGVDGNYIVFYDQWTAKCWIYQLTEKGFVYRGAAANAPSGATSVVPVGQTFVLFCNGTTGDLSLGEYVRGALSIYWTAMKKGKGWRVIGADNGLCLRHDGTTSATFGVRSDENDIVGLRDDAQGLGADLGSGFTDLVSLGGLP